MGENTIEKVYDIQTVGGKDTYNTFNSINQLFKEMRANKISLNEVMNVNVTNNFDVGKLEVVNKSFNQIVASNKELIATIRTLVGEMSRFGQIGSQMTASMATGMKGVNMANVQNIAGFRQFTGTMATATGAAINYNRALLTLGERLLSLREESESISTHMKFLNAQLKSGEISAYDFNTEMTISTAQLQKTKSQINEVTTAMNAMNRTYNPGLLDEENLQLAENKIQLQQRAALLKAMAKVEDASAGSVRGARAEIELLNREQENLIVVRTKDVKITDEQIAANIARRDAIIEEKNALHDFIVANADKNLLRVLNIGNYPQLKTEFIDLKEKMVGLALAGKAGTTEFKAFEDEALKLAAAMKEAEAATIKVDAALKKSTGVADKFISIVERMGLRMIANLVIFQAAIELGRYLWEQWTKDAKEAEEATKNAQNSAIAVSEATAKFREEEISKTKVLVAEINNLNNSYHGRLDAVRELIQLYPELLSGMSQEQILAGKSVEQMDKINKAIELRAEAERIRQSIEENRKGLPDAKKKLNEVIEQYNNSGNVLKDPGGLYDYAGYKTALSGVNDLEANIAGLQEHLDNVNNSLYTLLHPKHDFESLEDLKSKLSSLKQDLETMRLPKGVTDKTGASQLDALIKSDPDWGSNLKKKMADIKQLDELIKKIEQRNEKKGKEPHDYLNAELEARKKLNDFLSKIQQSNIQREIDEQREISDNTERSLAERLQAYAIYAADEKRVLQLQKDAEIKDVQDKLDKISEIETAIANKKAGGDYNKGFFDKSGNLRENEQVLLINKDELNAQLTYINTESKSKLKQLNRNVSQGITSITTSSVSKMLKDIEQDAATQVAQLEDRATKAKDAVTGNKATKDQKISGIDAGLNVNKDKTEIAANLQEQHAIEDSIQEAHIAKRVDEEKALQKQLTDLINKSAALREKLRSDEEKQKELATEKDRQILDALKTQSLSAFEEIGNAYVKMMEQQQAAREREQQRSMDWNRKQLDAQVQSNYQKQANDKAFFLAQQQMERDRFNNQKRLAEVQMAVDYATAVIKIIAANADLGLAAPAVDAIEIGALTGVYAAKLAMVSSQQFGQGGIVPHDGGIFGGRSHTAGGTPFAYGGRMFEAEAGEVAIINKRTAGSNQVMSVTGTPKQIASGLNSWGGGVNFAPGAQMYRFEYGGMLGAQINPPSFISDYYTSRGDRFAQADSSSKHIEMYSAIMAHAEAINSRIDRLQVMVNHHDVTAADRSYKKQVQVGSLSQRKP